jgi:hypothetical protein
MRLRAGCLKDDPLDFATVKDGDCFFDRLEDGPCCTYGALRRRLSRFRDRSDLPIA